MWAIVRLTACLRRDGPHLRVRQFGLGGWDRYKETLGEAFLVQLVFHQLAVALWLEDLLLCHGMRAFVEESCEYLAVLRGS